MMKSCPGQKVQSPTYLSYPGQASVFLYISLQTVANRLHEKQKVGSARRVTCHPFSSTKRLVGFKGMVRYPMTNNLRLTTTKKSSNVVLKNGYNVCICCMACQAMSCFIEKSFASKCPLDREQTVFLFRVQVVSSWEAVHIETGKRRRRSSGP